MSVNKVILVGRVGQMEVKTFDGQNGPRKCATFTFATSEKYKDRSGNVVENTEWHNIVAWNHAEFCEKYVTKGCLLYIEGKLCTRTWEDKQGNKRYTTEILEDKLDLLNRPDEQKQKPQQAPAQQPQQRVPLYQQTTPIPPAGEPEGDDLPF